MELELEYFKKKNISGLGMIKGMIRGKIQEQYNS